MHPSFIPAFDNPAGSPIRELFPYLSKAGMISFAGGYPSPSLFDAEGLSDASSKALSEGAQGLQYGATEGEPVLRGALAELCATRGIATSATEILVTTGSQQAFDLLVRIFIAPGDTVYVETPAYPAAIQCLWMAGAKIQEVPVDANGLDVDALEALLRSTSPHQRPKFLYTVPTFSNPSGTLLPADRRARLVRLAFDHGFLVIEDDPYGELRFTDRTPATIYAIGAEMAGADNPVVYLSSLSKTVAPALRIGWMIASPDILRRAAVAKQTIDLCTSPLNQAIAAKYLRSGRYPAAIARACLAYRQRMSAMVGELQRGLGDHVSFVQPEGGMFIWVAYDASVDPRQVFERAVKEGVLFVPGAAFYPDQVRPHTMRLSYAAPNVDQVVEGVARLGRAFEAN